MIDFLLGFACIALAIVAWRMKSLNSNLRSEVRTLQQKSELLQTLLEQAVQKLAEYETSPRTVGDGLFQRVVEGLVALGVPGLVPLVAVATSGFAGAAALTTALATLGGRWAWWVELAFYSCSYLYPKLLLSSVFRNWQAR